MSELCTYLLKFSTVKFTSSLSEDNRTHYSSLLYEKDINSVCDIYGNTPLHLAWMSGQSHLIVPLLKLGHYTLEIIYNVTVSWVCFPNRWRLLLITFGG